MTKYNKSKIMKAAWMEYKRYGKLLRLTFGVCLKRAWTAAKEAAREFTGIVKEVQVAGTSMHPVLVDVDMELLTVSGNTFPARQIFREYNLDWDGYRKVWYGARKDLNALCCKFA